jgi:hypothetical protein
LVDLHGDLKEAAAVPAAQPGASKGAAGAVVPLDRQGRQHQPATHRDQPSELSPPRLTTGLSDRHLRLGAWWDQPAEPTGKVQLDHGDVVA